MAYNRTFSPFNISGTSRLIKPLASVGVSLCQTILPSTLTRLAIILILGIALLVMPSLRVTRNRGVPILKVFLLPRTKGALILLLLLTVLVASKRYCLPSGKVKCNSPAASVTTVVNQFVLPSARISRTCTV